MKKSIIKSLLAMLLIACMMFTACSSGETTTAAPEGESTQAAGESSAEPVAVDDDFVLKCSYSGIADTLDLFNSAYSLATTTCFAQCYSPLITRDGNHELVPMVADKWEMSEDGMTYTFHIDDKATFSNGEKITSDDVLFTFEEVKKSGSRGHTMTSVDSAECPDASTIIFHLNYPDALFLGRVAAPNTFAIVSRKAYEEFGTEYGSTIDKAVYSGPYVPTEWEYNVSMTFKAREDYWLGAPQIKNVKVFNITDTNGNIVALQTGDLDFSWSSVSGSAYEQLKNAPGVHFCDYTGCRFEVLNFYHKSGMFSDIRMRQAVAYAVNPEDALQIGVDGKGFVIRYPYDTPMQVPALNYDSPNVIKQDLEKAKELVKECGNEGAHVVIGSYQPDPYPALSTWLQSVLNSIGLDAEVQVMERSAWLDACNAEELTISILSLNGSDYDMDGMINYLGAEYNGTRGNYGWYYSEKMEEYIKEAREKVGDDRADAFKKMIDLMWEDVALIPLFDWNYSLPCRENIEVTDGLNYAVYFFKVVK